MEMMTSSHMTADRKQLQISGAAGPEAATVVWTTAVLKPFKVVTRETKTQQCCHGAMIS